MFVDGVVAVVFSGPRLHVAMSRGMARQSLPLRGDGKGGRTLMLSRVASGRDEQLHVCLVPGERQELWMADRVTAGIRGMKLRLGG
jgi:hypothetical protein